MIKKMENIKKQIQLAIDAYKSGDFTKAESLCKKLIEENSKVEFLYNLLGLILVAQNKTQTAIEYYNKAIEINPNFAMAYNNLGLLYANDKSDYTKAEEYYKKSIFLDPKTFEAHNNLGSLYNNISNFNEAINSYKNALKINPKISLVHHNIGNVYIALGNFTEAKKHYIESTRLNPKDSNSHRSLSRLIRYTDKEKHFSELKNIYREFNDNEIENKSNIAFALGKAYEDTKDFEKSFFYYNEANTIYRKKINFSISDEIKKINNIKNTYYPELFEKYKNYGFETESPIFIVGMPRSGTTLVEQILSSHKKVYGAEEIEFIPNLIIKNFGHRNIDNLSIFFEKIVTFDEKNLKNIGEEYISNLKKISNNAERFTDKLPSNFLFIGFIKIILPKAKIVHIYRNSEDNCFSIFKNHFPGAKINFAYNLDEIVQYYNKYKDLMSSWKKIFPQFIYDIKYENLILNTKSEIEKLLKFCDLNWDSNCLNFYNNKKAVKTASDTQIRKKIYNTSINYWRNYEKYLSVNFSKLKN